MLPVTDGGLVELSEIVDRILNLDEFDAALVNGCLGLARHLDRDDRRELDESANLLSKLLIGRRDKDAGSTADFETKGNGS